MKNTTAVKDPVCGMDVDAATAAGRTEHEGQTYYFCGSKCKEKFDRNPEQYFGKPAGTPERPWLLRVSRNRWLARSCGAQKASWGRVPLVTEVT